MRYAIIADIHGNWPALQAVLRDIGRQHADAVYCLGDLFAPFGFASEIAGALRDFAVLTIRGNSEDRMLSLRESPRAAAGSIQFMPTRAVMEDMTEETWQFVGDLPRVRTVCDGLAQPLVLCHGTPDDSAEFLFRTSGEPNVQAIGGIGAGTIVAGHNHWAKEMRHGDLRVVYAGSVGLQFDEEHRVAYVVVETKDGAVGPAEYHFVRYDWQAFAAKLVGQGFLRCGGPISWIMFDEILSQEDTMIPFLKSSHAAGLANDMSAWAEACRAFLSAKGRWSHIEPYLR